MSVQSRDEKDCVIVHVPYPVISLVISLVMFFVTLSRDLASPH